MTQEASAAAFPNAREIKLNIFCILKNQTAIEYRIKNIAASVRCCQFIPTCY
jgi:hypothetical protein